MPEGHDPLDLRGQERTKSTSDEEKRRQREQELSDLKWLMGNKQGRRFMWRLLETAGVFRTSFTGNSTTFFNEGMRNMGLKQLNDVHEACPERYVEMVREHKEAKEKNDNRHADYRNKHH